MSSSRRWSYGDTGGIVGYRSSSVGKYDSSPRTAYSSTYDSGLRSYGSSRALNDGSGYGAGSLSRYGSTSVYESSSRTPRPSSVTMDRYSSSGNLGSGISSGSYRSSLEYSAPTRSYSYASGLSSGAGYSSPYSTGSTSYRGTSSYGGYGGGGLSSSGSGRDYGSSRGLSKRDDYGSYGGASRIYGSLNEAHSDITLRSTYTPKRYGTYDTGKDKSLYSGVLKSERAELTKSGTPEIEQAFARKTPDLPVSLLKTGNSRLQLPETTNDEFNTLYDRYVTRSPILTTDRNEEQSSSTVSSRRESESLQADDSAYSSKVGRDSETLSGSSDKSDQQDLEDDETEREESVTICCPTVENEGASDRDAVDEKRHGTAENGDESAEKEINDDAATAEETVEEAEEIEYSAESENEEDNSAECNNAKIAVQGFAKSRDDVDESSRKRETVSDDNCEETVPIDIYRKSPWEDFNSSFADEEEDDEEECEAKKSGVEVLNARSPWEDFASSFADEEYEEEAEDEAEDDNEDKEKNASLQKHRDMAASNASLWSDFDVPTGYELQENRGDDEVDFENENGVRNNLRVEQYKPALWEQFCSFDAATDNEEEEDEDPTNDPNWKRPETGRKYSIQIEAETDSESEDVSDRSGDKSHSAHRKPKASATMRFLAPPKRAPNTAETSASDVESEFDFNPNCVSATFPFLLTTEVKHEERGRVEAHLALPAPIFNIQVSYDSDFPDEESVPSVSDYEDLSENPVDDYSEDEEEEAVVAENVSHLKSANLSEEKNDSQTQSLPHIMVTSDASDVGVYDYQHQTFRDNDKGYDGDVSRPISMYASGDDFNFGCIKENELLEKDNTVTIFIKKPSRIKVKDLSPSRSETPDSERDHTDQSDIEGDKSYYHDARDAKEHHIKPLEQLEIESEVFVGDSTDDEHSAVSPRSDTFIDAPTLADVVESKVEPESAEEILESHDNDICDTAVQSCQGDAYRKGHQTIAQILHSAKVESDKIKAEQVDKLCTDKNPDTAFALSRVQKGVSEKVQLTRIMALVAPETEQTVVSDIKKQSVAKETEVQKQPVNKNLNTSITPHFAKQNTAHVALDRTDVLQSKTPQETWAKKAVISEPKLEKVVAKGTPNIQVHDTMQKPLLKNTEHVRDEKLTSQKLTVSDKSVESTKVVQKVNAENIKAMERQNEEEPKPKPRTTGIDKMSEKFESKSKPSPSFNYPKKVEQPKKPFVDKMEAKYPNAFNSATQEKPGQSFEEQMEELRRKMKAGSNQFNQQMKDFSKGITDVATNAKLVTEKEVHKTVLTDASNLCDRVSKKVDKWKESAEAESARREQQLEEVADKQAQKAKDRSAIKMSPSPIPQNTTCGSTQHLDETPALLQKKQEQAKDENVANQQKPLKTLSSREPNKVASPFMQKDKETKPTQSKIDAKQPVSLESVLNSKQAPLNRLEVMTNKLPEPSKASSASPAQHQTVKTNEEPPKAASLSPALPKQKAVLPRKITDFTQRLGPEGESDHEMVTKPNVNQQAQKSITLKQQSLEQLQKVPTALPSVTAKVKEDTAKQIAEVTKSRLTKGDIVEQGTASLAKVKTGPQLQRAEIEPGKIKEAPKKCFEAKSFLNRRDATGKKRGKCYKCKKGRNRFITPIKDIDDLLQNKESKVKNFEQFELLYQNCGRDKRSRDMAKPFKSTSQNERKIYVWDIHDIDKLYDDNDLRSLMGSFSPTSKVSFDFFTDVNTKNPQVLGRKSADGDHRQRIDESSMQIYKSYENGQGDFGSYLDPDLSLSEQPDELAILKEGRRTGLVMRTQLSVRVHAIIEKLLNSTGRDLRRALFSLKQIFQDDKDLVHEFVQNDGLSCLIKVGAEADQNYQNYILRALGQVMLYVDGMNGVIAHNETIQWLYSLLSSEFRLVVKTALKLLLVFVEYTESNSLLLLAAVYIVDKDRDSTPWSYLMSVLNDKDNTDLELLVHALTLINKTLNGIPDQDTYYDVVDAMEEQGLEDALKRMQKMNHKDLNEQCRLYESMLNQEDGDADDNQSAAVNVAKMRQTQRTRAGSSDRKSHRKQNADTSNGMLPESHLAKSKQPRFEQMAPKTGSHIKYGLEKSDEPETTNSASKPRPYGRRAQDAQAVPGLSQNKRLTMDLLYKKPTSAVVAELSEERVEVESPSSARVSAEEETPKTKCPPPKLPDLTATNDDGETAIQQQTAVGKQQQAVGAVHSLAGKFGSPKLTNGETTASANQQPANDDDDNDDDSQQANSFAAALNKRKVKMDKQMAAQQPVDSRKESDIQWEKAMESLNRPLIINDLDFTELEDLDDSDPLRPPKMNDRNYGYDTNGPGPGIPPPPPFGGIAPPPPPGSPRPPPPLSPANRSESVDQTAKDMKTVRLFWKEAQLQPSPVVQDSKGGVFWQKVKPVEIDSEKLVHLFETKATKEVIAKKKEDKKPEIRILDTKRSNAINIGLTKLPPPRAIKTAITKYDSSILNKEGIEKILSTMMPSEEEKEKIAEAQATNPEVPLGPAEQFLQLLSEIPALLPRLRLWLFMLDYANLEKEVAEPLMDLKLAMEEIEQSRTLPYVMGTLLAVGNVLNGAEIKGFQLDFLAKVPEVKDTVHKHSLVYHVCTIVREKFPDSTDLYSDLGAVVRCAKVDFDEVKSNLEKMEKDCKSSWDYLRVLAKHESSSLKTKIGEFLTDCAQRIMTLKTIHRRVINRFRKFLLYMGMPSHAVKDTKINGTCKTIAEFALDYRTCCDKLNQQKKRVAEKRERNKTRGKLITDVAAPGSVAATTSSRHSGGGRDEQRHEELSKVLQTTAGDDDAGPAWKNYPGARLRQRRNISPNNASPAVADGHDSPDDEILDGLVKAATVKTDHPREQRRKARQFNRKSLRRTRTLKLVQDQTGE